MPKFFGLAFLLALIGLGVTWLFFPEVVTGPVEARPAETRPVEAQPVEKSASAPTNVVKEVSHEDGALEKPDVAHLLWNIANTAFQASHPLTDDRLYKKAMANFKAVLKMVKTADYSDLPSVTVKGFPPLLLDMLTDCDGAYSDVPIGLFVDEEYVYGYAVFPKMTKDSDRVKEFVRYANICLGSGLCMYNETYGAVIFLTYRPMVDIRKGGADLAREVFALPAVQVNLFSEAYKAVLEGEKTPQEALKIVGQKLKKIM